MADHKMEQLAVQLAALPDAQREWLLARTKDLVKLKREVGARLRGHEDNQWGRIVAGGMIYDADGNALCRVHSVHIKSDSVDHAYGGRRVTTTIEITAYAHSEDR